MEGTSHQMRIKAPSSLKPMPKGNWQEFNFSESTLNSGEKSIEPVKRDLNVRVQKMKGGRNGKTVTLIKGLELNKKQSQNMLKRLKSMAGTGGTYKNEQIELQGDQVQKTLMFLRSEGYHPKQSGG